MSVLTIHWILLSKQLCKLLTTAVTAWRMRQVYHTVWFCGDQPLHLVMLHQRSLLRGMFISDAGLA
jgi:hypothetical protein